MSIRTSNRPASVTHVETRSRASTSASRTTGSCRASSWLIPPTRTRAPSWRMASARRSRFSTVDRGTQSRSLVAPSCRVRLRSDPADEDVFNALALQHFDNAGRIETNVVDAHTPSCAPRSARSDAISARNVRTASRESSRRPSIVIETSSGVAGPPRSTACRNASRSHSSTAATRFALTSCMTRPGRRPGRAAPGPARYQRCNNPECTGPCCEVRERPAIQHRACSAAPSSTGQHHLDGL
jgi:hypothetical protein